MTKNISRRNVMALLGVAPLVGAAVVRGETPKPAAGTKAEDITSRDRIRERHFPNVQLITHEGKKVRFYDDLIKDKIVVINFMYAKCEGICPGITTNLVKVQRLLGPRVGKDIFMYSFTLTPKEDTVPVIKHYADMHKAKPGWLFLTGSVEDMETVRRKLGFVDPDPEVDKDKSNHIGVLKYGNEPLQRWGGCPGMSEPIWIAETLSWVDWPQNRNSTLRERMSAMRSQAKGGAK